MDHHFFEEFVGILDTENKDQAVEFSLDLLVKGAVTLEELYSDLLKPSLTTFVCSNDDKELCIWKEHTRTSIVRTILECTYPFVVKRRKEITLKQERVMVFCPSEEYHEIGAIIVNNLFLLAGYDSRYIGANTPKNDIISAVKAMRPDIIAISVTNYYNIVVTKQIADEVKARFPQTKILIGGQAFLQPGAIEQVHHDFYLKNVEEIKTTAWEAFR